MKKETKGVIMSVAAGLACICAAGRIEFSGIDNFAVGCLIFAMLFGVCGKILIDDEH